MKSRVIIFLPMSILHLSAVFLESEFFSPIVAGSIYLPLLGLRMIGIPVFMTGNSGGWASPSVLGWALVSAVWLAVWWGLSGAVLKRWRKRNHA